ncbi:unnamed protein product [Alopecurus aequalis]
MVNWSSVSGLGMVVVAVVSAGVILTSYHLIHRCLDPNLKIDNIPRAEQGRLNGTKRMKKVRFADNLTALETSSDSGEYREVPHATAGPADGHARPALRKAAYSSLLVEHGTLV